ncbi:polymorphic toxin type 34 domain-containing protein [Microcoleus sp. herbarium19]|uniref:polymorphic toxin type 34 domain-containing protein n=1 Tax=unclassified Microcoleus TaxID=2642155 RepID=UPI002FD2DD4E
MTSEGNVADTGILQEAQQLMQDGSVASMGEALKILMENAERNDDKVKIQKIKTTQKAKRKRRSRHR